MLNVISKFGWNAKIAALAAVVLTALPAHALTLNPGDNVLNTFELSPSETMEFSFEPSENLLVSIISVAGSGFPEGNDLASVLFGINGADTGFTMFSNNGLTSSAEGMLPSFFASTPFTVNFAAPGTANDVGITYTFVTQSVETITPVPLPASGLMLGLVLLVGGGLALRRRDRV